MAVSITSAPDLLRPAGQPLVFKMEEATTPDRYIVQVYESLLTTTDGTLIGTYYITPDANGDGYFDLSDIAEGRVAAPDTQSAGVIHTVVTSVGTTTEPVIRKYTVKAGQYNAGTATLAEDSDVVYLLGGAMQISQGLHPSFADYYPTGSSIKSWLSDRQVDSGKGIRMVMAAEDEAIAVIIQTDNLGTATDLDEIEVKLFKNNINVATISNNVSSSVTVGENYLIVPLGPANLATYFGIATGTTTPSEAPTGPARLRLSPLPSESTGTAALSSTTPFSWHGPTRSGGGTTYASTGGT
jgi:hypothetical protein